MVLRANAQESDGSFAAIWREEFSELAKSARQQVSASLVEDVLQDVAIEGLCKGRNGDFSSEESIKHWLRKVTRLRAIDCQKKNISRFVSAFVPELSANMGEPSTAIEEDEVRSRLKASIEKLSAMQKRVIEEFLKGDSDVLIGKALGISRSAVRSHRHEAIKSLRKFLVSKNHECR